MFIISVEFFLFFNFFYYKKLFYLINQTHLIEPFMVLIFNQFLKIGNCNFYIFFHVITFKVDLTQKDGSLINNVLIVIRIIDIMQYLQGYFYVLRFSHP